MANVGYHLPDLFIAKNPFRCGHARGKDTVPNDPVKLAIGVSLHGRRVELRHGRRHFVSEGHTGTLAIQPVTDHAIGPEVAPPGANIFFVGGKWIHIRAPANSEAALCALHETGFKFARGAYTATGKNEQGDRSESGGGSLPDAEERAAIKVHGCSTTIVIFMLPWLAPQK